MMFDLHLPGTILLAEAAGVKLSVRAQRIPLANTFATRDNLRAAQASKNGQLNGTPHWHPACLSFY
jgi:hypothetical protein